MTPMTAPAPDATDVTLKDWRRTPHAYGESDCVLSAAGHFLRAGAINAMPDFAGTYHDHDGAMIVLDGLGGMESVMEIIGGVALGEGEEPRRGDIVGMVTDQADYVIPALFTGDGVAAKIERGVVEMRAGLVEWRGAWRARSLSDNVVCGDNVHGDNISGKVA